MMGEIRLQGKNGEKGGGGKNKMKNRKSYKKCTGEIIIVKR